MAISVQTGSLDIQGIVSGLMTAEKIPLNKMQTDKKAIDAKISNLGKIVSLSEALDTKAKAMGKISTMTKDQAITAVKEFVTAYNALNSESRNQTAKGASLQGDSSVSGIASKLRSNLFMNSPVGNIYSASGVGITTSKEGTLTFDETAFGTAFDSAEADVKTVLSNIAVGVDNVSGKDSSTGKAVQQRSDGFTEKSKRIQDRIDSFNEKLSGKENTYYSQFISLQKSLSSIQSSFNLAGILSSSSSN